MTSAGLTAMLKEDRVFFAKDCENCDAFSCDCTFDGFLKTLLRRISESDEHVQILVLVATRKLALQITESMKKFAKPMSVKVHACIGETSVSEEKLALSSAPHIIIGTPGRVKHMISSEFLVLSALDLFVMYDFRPLLSKDMREAVSSIVTSLPEDIQKGKCVCTSSRPHRQRLMEQFCKEMSLCNFYGVSDNNILQRDVSTPVSGIDDGGKAMNNGREAVNCEEPLEDESNQTNSFAHIRQIMAAVQSVDVERKTIQVLVIAPKVEEVKQISEELRDSLSSSKILIYCCCGQTSRRGDRFVLSNGVHVLIAPPKRARYLLRRECIYTDSIRVLVMVKADDLFCTGYKTLLHGIIQSMPESVQKVFAMEPNKLNNKKDGWYDKRQPRYKWRYFKSLIFLFLAVNVEVADAQYLEKQYQQQQPIVLQPSMKCDCPTFGYRLMKQNQEIDNNIRQNPAQIPNIPAFYRQDIPALMARPANPFLN
ncbi:unnamed protein product [Cylicocyclus nassatus]|uniref:ATP-dependent RNA helicase n=1 Tax=Cylicocyclus nassatus TaxID=53992 RepID=A0AA36GRW8_CYLNA|nr:unnamed protein product [Cylicocyclus nassatus]